MLGLKVLPTIVNEIARVDTNLSKSLKHKICQGHRVKVCAE